MLALLSCSGLVEPVISLTTILLDYVSAHVHTSEREKEELK